MNRREFLRRIGIGVGGAAVGAALPMSAEGLDEVVIEAVELEASQMLVTAYNVGTAQPGAHLVASSITPLPR